ncbi:MAG: LysR family transcriptional regulator, partial [Thermomicrobiales bacterium]
MLGGIARAEWLDLHKLRVFAAVAEHEHYSRAADALRISQPALSVHVRDLERYFGVALFERAGRNVRLTDAGRLVQDYARRILALTVEMDEAVEDLRGLRAGQLRLGASTTIGEYLLPDALAAFRRQYP